MLAFSNDYYGMIFRATQSVELFCAYLVSKGDFSRNTLLQYTTELEIDVGILVGRLQKEELIGYTDLNDRKRKIASTLIFSGDCFFSHRSLFLANLFRKSF